MTYWSLSHAGPAQFDTPSLAESYIADVGTSATEDSVRAWLAQRARTAQYTADVLGTSRAAAATARSWQQAGQNVSEITAAVRQLASPGADPDEAEVQDMHMNDWARQRQRFVKDYDEAEKAYGMFGPQTRVSLADRQPFDIWNQRKEHQ